MSKGFRTLYKETGKTPVIRILNNIFEIKKMIVQNDLDMVLYKNCIIICNKKMQNSNIVPNIVLDFSHISGDFILIGYNPKLKDFRSLDTEEINYYIEDLNKKSFQYKKYQKWLEKHSTLKSRENSKATNKNDTFDKYQGFQRDFAQKLNRDIENKSSNISDKNSDTEILEIILSIQAVILKYVKRKMNNE